MASLTHPDYCTVGTCDTRGCGSTITVDQYNECRGCAVLGSLAYALQGVA